MMEVMFSVDYDEGYQDYDLFMVIDDDDDDEEEEEDDYNDNDDDDDDDDDGQQKDCYLGCVQAGTA